MQPEPLQNAPRRLSVGDAIAVVALLAFAVGWIAFWTLDLDDAPEESFDAWTALIWIALIGSPALWAGGLVTYIVKGRGSSGE